MEFILQDGNGPFRLALLVMIIIGIVELLGVLFGMGISEAIESMLPDVDVEVDSEFGGIEGPGTIASLLGWLRVGEVPFLILLILFLTAFGVLGLAVQLVAVNSFGVLFPAWLVSIPVFLLALPPVRWFGGVFAKLLPKVESEVVSTESFIGQIAQITLGSARKGSPAEAKLTDRYHQTHYIMLEPDDDDVFEHGTKVLVVKKIEKGRFAAIRNVNESLVNDP